MEPEKDLVDFFEQRNVSFQVGIHFWVATVQMHRNLSTAANKKWVSTGNGNESNLHLAAGSCRR